MVAQNRSRRARENAGLSVGQAAKLLGMSREELRGIEELDACFQVAAQQRIARLYGVNVEWLRGDVPQRDYDGVRQIHGSERLEFADRDVIAEFAASMPRGTPEGGTS